MYDVPMWKISTTDQQENPLRRSSASHRRHAHWYSDPSLVCRGVPVSTRTPVQRTFTFVERLADVQHRTKPSTGVSQTHFVKVDQWSLRSIQHPSQDRLASLHTRCMITHILIGCLVSRLPRLTSLTCSAPSPVSSKEVPAVQAHCSAYKHLQTVSVNRPPLRSRSIQQEHWSD